MSFRALLAASVALLELAAVANARADDPANEVFRRFSPGVVQVRIVDQASGSKATIGSGFFAGRPGYVVTNYHVISDLVHRAGQYRAELVEDGGKTHPVELLNLDIVHDLAILRTQPWTDAVFDFTTKNLPKGARLFSLGNPHDLGSAIVEGTFNGLLENSLYEKIHFTGAINPGMSGGPAVTSSGQVAGINVSTAGNELSFLVPAKFASRLLAQTLAPGFQPPADFLDVVRAQLVANQGKYIEGLLAQPFVRMTLGPYQLPGQIAPFFKCWGHTSRAQDQPYEIVNHQCSTQDDIFITGRQSSGAINFSHVLVSSTKLNRFQFYSLYQSLFSSPYAGLGGDREQVTRFVCRGDFVEQSGTPFKVVLCLRAYKKLPGLYDAILKAASLHSNDEGVLTTLTLSGVSFANAQAFARRYLETISWKK